MIACGREANVLSRLADGEAIGTQLIAADTRCWRANNGWPIICNWPAAWCWTSAAMPSCTKGTSLLPIGVVAVEGEFLRGEALACVDPQGHEVARGLVNYSSDETRLIMRHATREIEPFWAIWANRS